MSAKSRTLHDLFLHQLRDLHYAERHGAKVLGKMGKVASPAVAQALDVAARQLHDAGERLDVVFDVLGKKSGGVPCEAMQGLVEEAKELMDDFEGSEALDAGLLAGAQAIAHYGIARYAALVTWAGTLDDGAHRATLEAALAERRRLLDALSGPTPAAAAEAADPAPLLTPKLAALARLG